MILDKLNSKSTLKILQVYAQTSAHDDEEMEEMYEDIAGLMDYKSTRYTIVIGDFNAKVGTHKQDNEPVITKYGVGQRNERGDRLVEFAISQKLCIANTWFKQRTCRKWTGKALKEPQEMKLTTSWQAT